MEKKYRLQIPEMIKKDIRPSHLRTLQSYDGDEVKAIISEESAQIVLDNERLTIPKEWLEEIKQPEILTAEEMLLEMSVEHPNNDQIMLHPNIIDYGEAMDLNGQLKLWHEGGVGELVEACKKLNEVSDASMGAVYLDLEMALEKIQKPE